MSNEWKKGLLNFASRLEIMEQAIPELFHVVFLHSGSSDVPLERYSKVIHTTPGRNIVGRWSITLDEGVTQEHLFFSEGGSESLQAFRNELIKAEGQIKRIPKTLLPTAKLPEIHDNVDRNVTLWLSSLYYLAWKTEHRLIPCELVGFNSNDPMPLFDDRSRIEDFLEIDPRPYFTFARRGETLLKPWSDRPQGLKTPDVWAAFIPKNILWASSNFIDRLVVNEAIIDAPKKSKPLRTRKSNLTINEQTDLLRISVALESHHSTKTGEFRHSPAATVDELAPLTGWSVGTVSKKFDKYFRGQDANGEKITGKQVYNLAVDEGHIINFIRELNFKITGRDRVYDRIRELYDTGKIDKELAKKMLEDL